MKDYTKEDYYRLLEIFKQSAHRDIKDYEIEEAYNIFEKANKLSDKERMQFMEHFKRQSLSFGNTEREKKREWLRYLVSTIAVVFGVLVALHGGTQHPKIALLCYVIAVVLIALSILFLGISLYSELWCIRKGKRLLLEDAGKVFDGIPSLNHRQVVQPRIFYICEIIGYICFALALLFLCAYELLFLILA